MNILHINKAKCLILQVLVMLLVSTHLYSNGKQSELSEESEKQSGKSELETLHKLIITSRADSAKVFIDELMDLAQKQSNDLYLACGYEYLTLHYFYVENLPDSVLATTSRGKEVLKRVNKAKLQIASERAMYDKSYMMLNHTYIHTLVAKHDYALALAKIQDFREDTKDEENPMYKKFIYYELGLIHSEIGNFKESIESYSQSLQYVAKDASIYELLVTLYSYYGIVEGYSLLNNDDKVIAWCDSIQQYTLENNKRLSQSKSYNLLNNDFKLDKHYAYSYISKGDMLKAKKYLDNCDAQFHNLFKKYVPQYYELKAYYYWKNNNLDLAYQYINKAIGELKSDDYSSRELNFFLLKADIMQSWGKSAPAYNILREVYKLNDSISSNTLRGQISSIESLYKVQRLEAEVELQESQLKLFYSILVTAILVTVLILIILFVIWKGYRRLKERNKKLYKSHQKLQEISEENKHLKFDKMLLKRGADNEEIIIQKLDKHMEETKMYLDPNVARDAVASAIYTNRQYLLDAIRSKRNQSFNEYIYSLRLQRAYDLIVNEQGMTILEIFEGSGFANRSVFNKEFKKEFGMPPSELRAIAREED